MNNYQYILDRSSKKHNCPECGKKSFVRYIDIETSNYLPSQYGRCDRESKCSYFLNPYKDGYAKEQKKDVLNRSYFSRFSQSGKKKDVSGASYFSCFSCNPVFFDFETFKATLKDYDKNVFINNLKGFSPSELSEVVSRYRLGTTKTGAITFPFIDEHNRVNAIQVKQFGKDNHTTGTTFLHSIIEKHCKDGNKPLPQWLEDYSKQDKKINCLFGSHLLPKYPTATVAIVEAPKTAIYCHLYLKDFAPLKDVIWLAVYNKSSFSIDKIKALKGRTVYVFPDLSKDGGTFAEWQQKANEYEKQLSGTRFIFFDLLEKIATDSEKANGLDIADYLQKYGVYNYPKEWDLPCERNPENDYWRTVNLLENLEGAVLAKDGKRVNHAIDSIYLFFGEDGDIPVNLMQKHCPTALSYI